MASPSTPVRTLFQQAYLINDLDTAAQRWSDLFGAGPFFAARHHQTDSFSYRGRNVEADVSYAFGYLGDTMIQFIQQHDDTPSIYRDIYAAGQEGFHHIAYLVRDFAGERQRLLDKGYPLACELYADGVNAAYFDTRSETGGFTEIHGDPPHILGMFGLWKRAHELRGADDPVLIEMSDWAEPSDDDRLYYQTAPILPLID